MNGVESNIRSHLSNKNSKIALLTIVLFGVVLRAILVSFNGVVSSNGGTVYLALGKNLAEGAGYLNTAGQPELLDPPLYPILIGIVYTVTNDIVTSGQIVVFLFNVLLIPATYVLAKQIYDKESALFAAFLVAIYPEIIRFSGVILSESVYTFFLLVSAIVFYKGIQSGELKWYIGTGISIGLAYLVKPIAIGYLLVFGVLTLFVCWRRYDVNSRKLLSKILVRYFIIFRAFMVLAAPYILYLYNQIGEFSLSQKSTYNFYIGLKEGAAYEEAVAGLSNGANDLNRNLLLQGDYPSIFTYIIENPISTVRRYVTNIGHIYLQELPSVVYPVALVLSGIAWFREQWKSGRWINELLLVGIVLYPFVSTPLFFVESRFIVPLLPFLLIWSGRGMKGIKNWSSKHSITLPDITLGIVILVLVSSLILPVAFVTGPYGNSGMGTESDVIEASAWVEQNTDSDAKIMQRKNYIGFYADRTGTLIPYANYTDVIEYANNHGVDYLVLYEPIIRQTRPQLSFLFDRTKSPPEDLTLVYSDDDSKKLYIYKINDSSGQEERSSPGQGDAMTEAPPKGTIENDKAPEFSGEIRDHIIMRQG